MSFFNLGRSRIIVERRAIEGRTKRRDADKIQFKATPVRKLRPIAAEVAERLRGSPMRFPVDWVGK